MSAKFRRICDAILEGGWLLAVVLITLYFNIYTKDSRIFEPQKALFLRFLVTVMLAVWAVRVLEEQREKIQEKGWLWKALLIVAAVSLVLTVVLLVVGLSTWQDPLADMAGAGVVDPTLLVLTQLLEAVATFLTLFGIGLALVGAGYALRTSWKEALRTAMVIPALSYVGAHLISTIGSVFPQASLYGGYVRQQGTITVLAYIGLFFVLACNLRRREQLERLITVILVASIPATLYGIVQRLGIDPLPWMGNVESRVASTMGNAIFIAAYLILVLPFTGYRLLNALDGLSKSRPPDKTPPQKSPILKIGYVIALAGAIAAVLVIILIGVTVANLNEAARIAQDTTLTMQAQAEQTAAVWDTYANGLLLFAAVALLTLALPALVYTVLVLIRAQLRPYAHLVAVAVAFLLALLIVALPSLATIRGEQLFTAGPELAAGLDDRAASDALREQFQKQGHTLALPLQVTVKQAGSSWIVADGQDTWYVVQVQDQALAVYDGALQEFLEAARVSGFFWCGYLLGLLGLALLSRWQHHRQPWGSDALWSDAVYLIVVAQSIFLFAVIQAYLPRQPYPSDWWLYLAALLAFFGTCYLVAAARTVGRASYLLQVLAYSVLAALQVLCIFLTQSRGPLIGLMAGGVVFVLVTLVVVARNARCSAAEAALPEPEAAPDATPPPPPVSGPPWPETLGRALGFSGLLVLNVAAVGLLLLGVWRTNLLFLILGGVGLFITWIISAFVLFGPGVPRRVGQWLLAGLAVLFGGMGLLVAMVLVERGRRWLWLSVLLPLVLLVLGLLTFNLPDTPGLNVVMNSPAVASLVKERLVPLKSIPYVGRLGRLLDSSSGTGLVRRLIWFGDEIGEGSAGMILHNPLRTLIGYGPETMHVAYNPYYPPELAHVEKRNASPDRAHNAIIDELVTLGAVGLATYFFYFIAFFVLAQRLLRKAPDVRTQALLVALLALGAAHFAETLFGIPIVSTRMYLWIAIGITVALTFMPPFRAEEVVTAAEGDVPTPERLRRRRRAERLRPRGIPGGWFALYGTVALAALIFAWRVNIVPMQADLLFWQSEQMKAQAQALQKNAQSTTDATTKQKYLELANDYANQGLQALHAAISTVPREDFYYLSLAQTYLNSALATPAASAPPVAGDPCSAYWSQDSFFESTELAISRARDLSPLNTDHYRNFAALYIQWFQSTMSPRRPAQCLRVDRLTLAIAYGEQAISLTSNNADLRNRQAQAYLLAASTYGPAVAAEVKPKALAWLQDWDQHHLTSGGRPEDTHLPLVAQYRDEALGLLQAGQDVRGLQTLAAAELQYSLFLDEKYADTYLALGDLYWNAFNMPGAAALTYAQGIQVKHTLISDSRFDSRLNYLSKTLELAPIVLAYENVAATSEANLQTRAQTAAAAQIKTWHTQASDVYQLIGYIHSKYLKDSSAAMRAYEAALTHSEAFDSHHNLAILYSQTGRLAEALSHAQAALPLAKQANQQTQLQTLLVVIGQQAYNANQDDTAAAAYRTALAANPQHFEANYGLALLYQRQGRLAEALTQAEAALQVAPEDKKAAVQALVDALKQAQGDSP